MNSSFWDPAQALQDAFVLGDDMGVNPCISPSTTFAYYDAEDMTRVFSGQKPLKQKSGYLYTRHTNPTVCRLGSLIAAMEDTEACAPVASGMAAITCALNQLVEKGDHVISSPCIYGGTYAYQKNLFEKHFGVTLDFADFTDLDEVNKKLVVSKTRLVYFETIANPVLAVASIPDIAQICKENGTVLVVDNTFSPLIVTPAQHGADIVVYSTTKFLSGSSIHVGGAICGSENFIDSLLNVRDGWVMLAGPTMDPFAAFDIAKDLESLPIRVKAHSTRAAIYANRLKDLGLEVHYPGLASHPHHVVLSNIGNPDYGFGGMIALDLGTEAKAKSFANRLHALKFGILAVSLGFSQTLFSCSGSSTSSEIPEDKQKAMGLSPGLLRLSIGYTGNMEIMWQRLEQALKEEDLIS